jgi:hypothetical protein
MVGCDSTPVRPEPVEGQSFFAEEEKGQGFDKLSPERLSN